MIRARVRQRAGGGFNPTLSRVIPGTVFQIDATQAASYPGTGQTVANLIKSPSDGTAQTGYDYWLGADNTVSTDDPTFTGTAGTPSAYFAHDGGDDFALKASTTFLNDIVRTDQVGSVYMVATFQLESVGTQQFIAGNGSLSSTAGGIRFLESSASSLFRMQVTTGAGISTVSTAITPVAGVNYLAIVVYNKATQVFKAAINARTFTTYTALAVTNTVSNSVVWKFGTAGLASQRVSTGSRLYSLAVGQGDLTDAQAAAVFDYYNALHGRTYA